MTFVAIVGVCDVHYAWTRILAALGPFATEEDAVAAGKAEVAKHSNAPGNDGNERELTVEYEAYPLTAPAPTRRKAEPQMCGCRTDGVEPCRLHGGA